MRNEENNTKTNPILNGIILVVGSKGRTLGELVVVDGDIVKFVRSLK